jgi:hypothetical protein
MQADNGLFIESSHSIHYPIDFLGAVSCLNVLYVPRSAISRSDTSGDPLSAMYALEYSTSRLRLLALCGSIPSPWY